MLTLLNVDVHFVMVRQTAMQLNPDHKANQSSHSTVRDRRGKLNFHCILVDRNTGRVHYLQFFERIGVFRVVDVSDHIIDLVSVNFVVNLLIKLHSESNRIKLLVVNDLLYDGVEIFTVTSCH